MLLSFRKLFLLKNGYDKKTIHLFLSSKLVFGKYAPELFLKSVFYFILFYLDACGAPGSVAFGSSSGGEFPSLLQAAR